MKKRFKDNGDGTVTDLRTGLMWQKDTVKEVYKWEDALKYCKGLKLAGHSDWRLPDIKELFSLVDETKYSPAIDTIYFPNTQISWYWSSSSYAPNTNRAWSVYFYFGNVDGNGKDYGNYVRCVRGVQKGD